MNNSGSEIYAAGRFLLRRPALSAFAVLTLALGIGSVVVIDPAADFRL